MGGWILWVVELWLLPCCCYARDVLWQIGRNCCFSKICTATALGYKVVVPFRVTCKVGAFPHVAAVTAVFVFHRGSVSPYKVSTDRTGPCCSVVVGQWVISVATIIC